MKSNILRRLRHKKLTRNSKTFTEAEAAKVAKNLGIDFSKVLFSLSDFTKGMNVELEHGKIHAETNVTNSNPLITGKIALAHLNEFPDYYERLEKLEEEAKKFWMNKPKTRI